MLTVYKLYRIRTLNNIITDRFLGRMIILNTKILWHF